MSQNTPNLPEHANVVGTMMKSTKGRGAGLIVEYDGPGGQRLTQTFKTAPAAKRFYVQQDAAGLRPRLLGPSV
jgi:hypothetical protein